MRSVSFGITIAQEIGDLHGVLGYLVIADYLLGSGLVSTELA
jgi:hypothetical protein